MADFSRPPGFRFKFKGMKTNNPPDALAPDKYAFAQNVRGYDDDTVTSRPQLVQTIPAPIPNNPTLSLEPTLGVYKVGGTLYLNSVAVDSGYSSTLGASLVPFRPNASPDAWEYVFDDLKSTKVNTSGPTPIVKKVGIVEPQIPVDAAVSNTFQSFMDTSAAGYTLGGTATSISNVSRITDTVGAVFLDPASSGGRTIFQVSPSQSYSKYMVLTIHGELYYVDDVFPNLTTPLSILGIYYYTGTTGKCVVVPNNLAGEEPSLYTQLLLSSIRRGAIVSIGGELCLVLSSSLGPDGSISFETSTTGAHSAGEQLIIADAVAVIGGGIVTGQAISSPAVQVSAGSGISTISHVLSTNPFVGGSSSFQPDDYIHFSIRHDNLVSLQEVKILFDVGDGSFTQNFYYYTVRKSDLADSVNNAETQLAAAQIMVQRALIDEEKVAAAHNQGRSASSSQTGLGFHQWSEIYFSISELTRVGDDQNKTLQNVNAVQILFNAVNPIVPLVNSLTVFGGFSADSGFTGMPYHYWYVPRDSTTGAHGNPSPDMRYGVTPRRQLPLLTLPTTYPDPQVDTLDIFRMGGSMDVPRYLGSVLLGTVNFQDTYSEDATATSRAMERDNYEPFPSIGPPLSSVLSNIIGTTMVASFPAPYNASVKQLAALLPGNEFNVGQQVFTLWARPTLLFDLGTSQEWLFQFVENAGVLHDPLVQLNEPALAAQSNQSVWGPDSNGVFFSVQDPLRPGVVNHTNPNNPDGASDAYTDELCAPAEPLQNGALLNQTSIVFSPNRAWAGYPKQGGSGYRWVEIPVGAGLAAQSAICTDGRAIYYVAKDGIRATSGGPSESLTDEDLFNLFPHEGVFPVSISTPAGTIFPPDYSFANSFRLSVVNGYLFFDYISTTSGVQTYRSLVCDIRRKAWSLDISAFNTITIHAGTTLPGVTGATKNQQLYIGDSSGAIYTENSTPTPATGEVVTCHLITREVMNDLRASSMFGDASVDCLPQSPISITPIFLGTPFAATLIGAGARTVGVVDLAGQQIKRSLGLMVQWQDVGVNSKLYSWQPSIVPQPEDTTDRFGDWDDAGAMGSKFFQGVLIEADTFGQTKTIVFRNGDDGTIGATLNINHVGQQQKSYSFLAPFVAHLVREEPDSVPWRKFGIKYVFEPTPSTVLNWQTQATSHGLPGYQHVKELLFAYNATAQVTFTLTVDGVPQSYTLPATSGYQKVLISLQAIKGLVFQYDAVSTQGFQIWVNDIEVKVKPWGDPGPYLNWQKMGAVMGPNATI